MSRRALLMLLLVLTALLPACRFDGLQFTADHRVEWVTEDRAIVTPPFTLEWRLRDFQMVGPDGSSRDDAGFVAIFVDRQPQAPFAPLTDLAADDDGCLVANGCPNIEWFTDRGIYPVGEGDSLTIDQLPPTDEQGRELRDFTLVLLDGQGRRLGESAFRISLEIDRDASAAAEGTGHRS